MHILAIADAYAALLWTVEWFIKKVEETDSVEDQKDQVWTKNIAALAQSVAQEHSISPLTDWCILNEHFHLLPFKINLTQKFSSKN